MNLISLASSIGDINALGARASTLGYDAPIKETDPGEAPDIFDQCIPAIHIPASENVVAGIQTLIMRKL